MEYLNILSTKHSSLYTLVIYATDNTDSQAAERLVGAVAVRWSSGGSIGFLVEDAQSLWRSFDPSDSRGAISASNPTSIRHAFMTNDEYYICVVVKFVYFRGSTLRWSSIFKLLWSRGSGASASVGIVVEIIIVSRLSIYISLARATSITAFLHTADPTLLRAGRSLPQSIPHPTANQQCTTMFVYPSFRCSRNIYSIRHGGWRMPASHGNGAVLHNKTGSVLSIIPAILQTRIMTNPACN
jgi:hypothetical protein